MSLLVVGSMALDSVKTPFGEANNVLGGSASYFSLAASHFTKVNIVAVVGGDFPKEHLDLLKQKEINTDGVEKEKNGFTFRWEGEYGYDLSEAKTLSTHLNVFETFKPVVPVDMRDIKYVFLANIDPVIQMSVLKQINKPRLVACDTMNFWIENKLDDLKLLLNFVDVLMINDSEARELSGEPIIAKAARKIMDMGPKTVVIKRGEYGALMFNGEGIFFAPSYPLEDVFDPTGAGDTFAGGFMGYMAGRDLTETTNYKKAVFYGSVMASFTVESFSVNRLAGITEQDISDRYAEFAKLSSIEP